jgi:hypothetical protein
LFVFVFSLFFLFLTFLFLSSCRQLKRSVRFFFAQNFYVTLKFCLVEASCIEFCFLFFTFLDLLFWFPCDLLFRKWTIWHLRIFVIDATYFGGFALCSVLSSICSPRLFQPSKILNLTILLTA